MQILFPHSDPPITIQVVCHQLVQEAYRDDYKLSSLPTPIPLSPTPKPHPLGDHPDASSISKDPLMEEV